MHTHTRALRGSIGQILTEVKFLSLVHNFYSFSLFLEREGTEMSCNWLGMESRSWSFSLGAILDIYGGREKNSCTTYSWRWWWLSYGHMNHTKDAQLGFPFFQNNWGRGGEEGGRKGLGCWWYNNLLKPKMHMKHTKNVQLDFFFSFKWMCGDVGDITCCLYLFSVGLVSTFEQLGHGIRFLFLSCQAGTVIGFFFKVFIPSLYWVHYWFLAGNEQVHT